MQAYASAPLVPLEPHVRVTPGSDGTELSGSRREFAAQSCRDANPTAMLASLVLDAVDEIGLAVLAQRLLPHLRQPIGPTGTGGHVAYTVASLADDLGVSQKTIRSAIARRELDAVKRGSRWIISAEAVRAWATAPPKQPRRRQACRAAAPKAAGPSLRLMFCGGTARGGAR